MKQIRRKDREIAENEAIRLLVQGKYGILSTSGSDGQPYGIPLSYVYKNNCIYFHCALSGHKLENIADNPNVSFCVVGKTNLLPFKFGNEYESVVVFGVASDVHGAERSKALLLLLEKYSPGFIEQGKKYIEKKDKATTVMKITVKSLTGKRAQEKR